MAKKSLHESALALLRRSPGPLSLPDLAGLLNGTVPERTLRRWLAAWVEEGIVARTGKKRGTVYRYRGPAASSPGLPHLGFLVGLDAHLKVSVLKQLRDLWTHTSTALEGNTLTLGDTHFVLEEGLTISGKPVKDHQEVIGHARAIDLLYRCLDQLLTTDLLFELHKAVQADIVSDIYKPNGAWKREPNGTYAVSDSGEQIFIEYATPDDVPLLMTEVLNAINAVDPRTVNIDNAPVVYAKFHTGLVHIHPFWDGNGRMARLVANIPLLKAGLPPLLIPNEERRNYIQILANYQINTGQLNRQTGVWPDESRLTEFNGFCAQCYTGTRELIAKAFVLQNDLQ